MDFKYFLFWNSAQRKIALIILGMMSSYGFSPPQKLCDCATEEKIDNGEDLVLLSPRKEEEDKLRPLLKASFEYRSLNISQGGAQSIPDCSFHLGQEFQSTWDTTQVAIENGTYQNFSDFIFAIPNVTGHMNTLEKQCFLAKTVALFKQNYDWDDLFSNLTPSEIYNNYQNGLSTGVCVHLHHLGARVGEAMGFKCGVIATNWRSPESDGVTRNGNHAVTLCQDESTSSYFLTNYGDTFKLDAATYSEAIDSLNRVIGPMNLQGSITSCLGSDDKIINNCSHEYIPADSRWALYAIKKSLDGISSTDRPPMEINISNVGLNFQIHATKLSSSEKDGKGDTIIYQESGNGIVGTYQSFLDNHFLAFGYGHESSAQKDNEETRITKLFAGVYYNSKPNNPGFYAPGDFQTIWGPLIYLQSRHTKAITPSTNMGVQLDVAATVDGTLNAVGLTDQLMLFVTQEFSPDVRLQLEQTGAINGDAQYNGFNIHPERTTLSLETDLNNRNQSLNWNNSAKFHFLPSGEKRDTVALEIEGELRTVIESFHDFSMGATYVIGQTFSSDDPFYTSADGTPLLFYDISTDVSVSPSKNSKILVYGELASSDMPSWFGNEPLIIDPKILPAKRMSGYEVGIQLEVLLGKRKK